MAWMRSKSESDKAIPEPPHEPQRKAAPDVRLETRMESIVNIGQSVHIKGELSGNEDHTIEGQVDGKIVLKDHNLTIGPNGRITAEIRAKNVSVLGQVIGNIVADDKVDLAPTGSVQGDIRAPRVAVADGARFKGSIDMERKGDGVAAPVLKAATMPAGQQPGTSSTSPTPKDMARSASPIK